MSEGCWKAAVAAVMLGVLTPGPAEAGVSLPASGPTIVFDFETDESGGDIVHGQIIDPAFDPDDPEFGAGLLTVTSRDLIDEGFAVGPDFHNGVTAFDSDLAGDLDEDLQVGSGNILILQNSALTDTVVVDDPDVGLVYVTPDDEANTDDAGAIVFSFAMPVLLESLDLVDIDEGVQVTATLTDAQGLTRTFLVTPGFTVDINEEGIVADGLSGIETLEFAVLAAQPGENGGEATATEDAGFDLFTVVELDVAFAPAPGFHNPSGGLDNLVVVIPEPGVGAVVLAGLPWVMRRRR
ncbi:MAG: hypothetical protein AAFX76_07610 [Planctomycetota bacterium]